MITIGERITQLRKIKNWSQEELAGHIDTSRIMVGKYERNDSSPSIDVVIRIARAFEVSVDFLVGEGVNANYDKETVRRLDNLEKLPTDQKDKVFEYIDLIVRDFNAKQAYK